MGGRAERIAVLLELKGAKQDVEQLESENKLFRRTAENLLMILFEKEAVQ